MWERVERSRQDGDTAFFMELLYLGELVTKLAVSGVLSGVADDRERHRYRQLHRLVRADGLGGWPEVLDEILTGPTSLHLVPGAREAQKQMNERVDRSSWQHEAVSLVHRTLVDLGVKTDDVGIKVDLQKWFVRFAALRNRTRGHGAVSAAEAGRLYLHLEPSLRLITDRLLVFQRPWAYLHRNLSRKYRVTPLTATGNEAFGHLKSTITGHFEDGVYVDLGEPLRVPFVYSNPEATDFFLPNGAFNGRRFEIISYVTNQTRDEEAAPFLAPATDLPKSETDGRPALDVQGQCFGNLPMCPRDYVSRPGVEAELYSLLTDDRHPIVTLAGRGGIGKTSLALAVLHRVAEATRFSVVLWLSARDVDLLPIGPKPVAPQVLTTMDMAREVVRLLSPGAAGTKGSNRSTTSRRC